MKLIFKILSVPIILVIDLFTLVFGPTAVKIPFETGLVKEIYS